LYPDRLGLMGPAPPQLRRRSQGHPRGLGDLLWRRPPTRLQRPHARLPHGRRRGAAPGLRPLR